MKVNNFISILFCAIALLSEWSKDGQLTFAFPFFNHIHTIARSAPESFEIISIHVLDGVDQRLTDMQDKSLESFELDTFDWNNPDSCVNSDFTDLEVTFASKNGTSKSYIQAMLGQPQCTVELEGNIYSVYSNKVKLVFVQYGLENEIVDFQIKDFPT